MSHSQRFAKFEQRDLLILYEALVALVSAPRGKFFFHNCDRGHPSISQGKRGNIDPAQSMGPTSNSLFELGHELHCHCIRANPKFFEDGPRRLEGVFSSWERFCEVAYAAYQAGRDGEAPLSGDIKP